MNNNELMRRAIALSEESVNNGGGPFGAVIARNGEIVAEAANRVTLDNDPTAHAEDNIYYANNREDAANIGFDDDFIYHEIALKPSERSKNMELLLPEEAINAFKMWEEKVEKTEY